MIISISCERKWKHSDNHLDRARCTLWINSIKDYSQLFITSNGLRWSILIREFLKVEAILKAKVRIFFKRGNLKKYMISFEYIGACFYDKMKCWIRLQNCIKRMLRNISMYVCNNYYVGEEVKKLGSLRFYSIHLLTK